jgi:hypothetical protein
MSWRSVTALVVLAFAGGAAGFAWLSSEGSLPWMSSKVPVAPLPEEGPPPVAAFATPNVIQPSASQAEAVLLITNARRAVEAGKPLGDLGSRLQVSFGQSQPQALAAIANGVRQPVSTAELLAGFDAIAPQLVLPMGTAWDRMQYEAQTLFVLRSANSRPTTAAMRIERIRKLIIAGDIAEAVTLVRVMPGAVQATGWLAAANRAIAVHQALDMLEQSAAAPPPPIPIAPPVSPTDAE